MADPSRTPALAARRTCRTCGADWDSEHARPCWFVGRVRERHTEHVVVSVAELVRLRAAERARDEARALVSELKAENAQLRAALDRAERSATP